VIVNYMREYQLSIGIPREQAYNQTMLVLAGMLLIGLACNLLIKPVASKWFIDDCDQPPANPDVLIATTSTKPNTATSNTHPIWLLLAWSIVAIPLAWGIYKTLINAAKFFS
jgi:hypothetical protein